LILRPGRHVAEDVADPPVDEDGSPDSTTRSSGNFHPYALSIELQQAEMSGAIANVIAAAQASC